MARVLDLTDIFQLVVDRFNDRSFPQQYPIENWHQPIFHVFSTPSNQLQPSLIKLLE